ncbi:MAG: hypothetical protein MI867_04595, partial [Pseudomonadales bacterium]|nr:hypothetical protein [Pseudomonadales bacterium]
ETRYEYDANGNLTKEIDPLGNASRSSYDSQGNVSSITDPNGNAGYYYYDNAGQVRFQVDPLGYVTENTYNALGKIAETRIYKTAISATGSESLGAIAALVADDGYSATSYRYDAQGQLTKLTDALGQTEIYEYDVFGNRTNVIDKNGNKTDYIYDVQGRLVAEIDALGYVTTTSYDVAGNVVEVTRHANAIIKGVKSYYDAVTSPEDQTVHFEYDQLGRLTHKVDPLGYVTSTKYDALGNAIFETKHANTINTLTQTGSDVVIDPVLDRTSWFFYNELGQKTHVVEQYLDQDSQSQVAVVTSYKLDALNNVLSTTKHATKFSVSGLVDAAWLAGVVNHADDRTTYQFFNESNQLVFQVDAGGYLTHKRYDSQGRLTEE